MSLLGFLSSSVHSRLSVQSPIKPSVHSKLTSFSIVRCGKTAEKNQETKTLSFGFKSWTDTFSVDIHRAEGRPLDAPLIAPFTIASSNIEKIKNVAVRIELSNGSVGWGEAPVLPSVTPLDQKKTLAKTEEICEFLRNSKPKTLSSVLNEVGDILRGHDFSSVRAAVEMALIDAAAYSTGIPLWRLFGGFSNSITTHITIPSVSPSEASKLAEKYYKEGFGYLKLVVGKDINNDIEVLKAIQISHPNSSLILDANEGYTAKEAIELLRRLYEIGVAPVLFEQPVHRDDWDGLGEVSHAGRKYGISIAADESCRSLSDAHKIIDGRYANVINIKLAKLGVLGSLEIIELAKRAGISLMLGGMVETRIAMGFAAHLAAGNGSFGYVYLDAPLLLAKDPVFGGYQASGAIYKLTNTRGHGGFLHWDYATCLTSL